MGSESRRRGRSRCGQAILFILPLTWALACSRNFDPNNPEDLARAIEIDVETLCERSSDGSIHTWGQAALLTEQVSSVVARMDRGEKAAYCELGEVIERRGPDSCQPTAAFLMTRCEEPAPVES